MSDPDAGKPSGPDPDRATPPQAEPHTGPDTGAAAGDGQSETVGAPFRDAAAPTPTRGPFVWLTLVVVAAVLVGGLLVALALGMLD